MTKDYRRHLKAIGRKSIGGLKLRTARNAGDLEIIRDHKDGEYRLYRHGEEAG